MQTSYSTIADIFGVQRQYSVPLFQRPYVWEQKTQLEPLWDDVRRLADATRAGVNPQPHFLGSVVLEKANTQSYPERRDVIDGQQRLTTLQILLKAAQDAFTAVGEPDRAAQLRSLLRNFPIGPVADEQTFKVLPTNVDREAYALVMRASSPDEIAESEGRIVDAYRFFHGRISEWLAEYAPNPGQARDAFFVTCNQRLKFVVLDLDQNDEAQVIFETLNARGTPLLPADLVKNWLLREVERRGLHQNIEQLYNATWSEFDSSHEYWRKVTGRGHAARARIDTYLANYLTMRLMRPVPATHLYAEFLDLQAQQDPNGGHLDGQQVIDPVARLKDLNFHTSAFRRIEEATEPSPMGIFLRRLKAMDVVSLTPFLLALLERSNGNQSDTLEATQALESYLVRRMICGLDTRGYTAFFVDLLAQLRDIEVDQPLAPTVRSFLLRSSAESTRWPDDTEFEIAWISQPLYNRLTRPRLRMLLLALEQKLRSAYSEEVIINEKDLQIEHVMPQSWQLHWGIPDATQEAEDRRNSLIHTIGNLTLVTRRLNPSLSNSAWIAATEDHSKRVAIAEHSLLRLNYQLVNENEDRWDEERIMERSRTFCGMAKSLWPYPSALAN